MPLQPEQLCLVCTSSERKQCPVEKSREIEMSCLREIFRSSLYGEMSSKELDNKHKIALCLFLSDLDVYDKWYAIKYEVISDIKYRKFYEKLSFRLFKDKNINKIDLRNRQEYDIFSS